VSGSVRITPWRRRGQASLPFFFVEIWLAVLLLFLAVRPSAEAATTWVSLTFDDGLTQSAAHDILQAHGMKGTFYVNSNKIGTGSYLTKAELDALFLDGHEIGGHTINHVDLATLSGSAQRDAICNDMQNLVNWYGVENIHSFAYPYSSTGPTTESIVAGGCPNGVTYESARAVGDLRMPSSCTSCAYAESIPPRDPYYIRTQESVKSTTSLAEIEGYITNAESHGGGWVPLVLHKVCIGCDTYSVSPATLDALLTWLEGRQPLGTRVATVHQVMSGDLPDSDTTPPTVSLTQPTSGATLTGPAALAANAQDNVGVSRVDFLAGATVVGTDSTSPYSITWDTATASNGAASLTAKAYDAAGNSATSAAVNVTVNNATGGGGGAIINPSLEIDANNDQVPDCWQQAGYGTNSYTWTRTTDAHSGGFAEKLQITSRSSGDRELIQTQGSGACARPVTVGTRYTLTGWYKSNVVTEIEVYTRNSSGVWVTGPTATPGRAQPTPTAAASPKSCKSPAAAAATGS
jgi:peptidoglycan/xylan/chitin deacetylase (PgdA/CDA1 family)